MPIIERTSRENELAAALAVALATLGASVDAGRPDFATFTQQATTAFASTLSNVYVDAGKALVGQAIQTSPDPSVEEEIDRAAEAYVAAVAPTLARGMAQNTAAALIRRPLAPGSAQSSFLFSPKRAAASSITEVTRTGSQADRISARTIVARLAMRQVAIWRTAEDDLVCPICRPLNNLPETGPNGWASRVPGGSPAHIGCRCEIVYRFEPIAGPIAGQRI